MDDGVDVVIIGGGVVGCAVAQALAARRHTVMVLEREARLGTGVTSRNSGVVHSGLYYPPSSLKTATCIEGNRRLYTWCARAGVWHEKVGKLVVASRPAGEEALARLHDNARASGAPGVRMLSRNEVRAYEPHVPCVAALFCAETGIVDVHDLVTSLRDAATAHGAVFAVGADVRGIETTSTGFRLHTTRGDVDAAHVVNAAGLYADDVARMVGVDRWRIHPCRGDYFRLTTKTPYRHLVYPVKEPSAAGLGVHLTLERGGGYRLGPDVEWVARRDDFSPAHHKLEAFRAATERLLGPLGDAQLTYDGCGIRPKLRAPSDPDEKDFVVVEEPAGCVHLLGIESPGLTASLALAARVEGLLCAT